jgi:RNA polymerase sigma-70 factor (ECF subfamily)
LNQERETRLVEAAQKGCIESFGALYEHYYSSMAALAYSVLCDRQLAEDAAQEVFAIACKDIADLKSKEKFALWLAGICRNTAKQMLRVNRNKLVSQTNKSVAASSRSDGDDLHTAIKEALSNLKDSERELITLRYYDNLPYERIASVLGISTQAVHGRLIRAKRKIAKYLKRNGVTGDDYE